MNVNWPKKYKSEVGQLIPETPAHPFFHEYPHNQPNLNSERYDKVRQENMKELLHNVRVIETPTFEITPQRLAADPGGLLAHYYSGEKMDGWEIWRNRHIDDRRTHAIRFRFV